MDNKRNVLSERISSNYAEENRKIKREMTGHSEGHCLVCLPNSGFPMQIIRKKIFIINTKGEIVVI